MDKKAIFFAKPADFRNWLDKNHNHESELWVGYYKKASGIPSITWPESVDQALCFGWIDGLRKSIDDVSYKIRFTPRKPSSHWSDINIRKVKELKGKKLMKPEGLAAFAKRTEARSRMASFEQKEVVLNKEFEKVFRSKTKAWQYFNEQPTSYQKASIWWIMSAKKEETKCRRLDILIKNSEEMTWIPQLRRP